MVEGMMLILETGGDNNNQLGRTLGETTNQAGVS